jgi:predicted transcriptional regulator
MKKTQKKCLTSAIYLVNWQQMNKEELRRLFKKSGLNQQELAQELGVSKAAVCMWLSGKRIIRPAFAKLIRLTLQKKRVAA